MMMGIRQGQSIRGSVVAAASLLMFCILIPRAAYADIVHLKNGRAMEGVVLEETPDKVVLQLAFGEIGLPRSSVDRIEPGRSPLQEFLERRSRLEKEQGRAAAWLGLALWAELEGLDHSAREATLIAARLDPGLSGLEPLMTALGYEYEENLAVWLPVDEMMRRRGYVLSQGRWLSPGQAAALQRAQEEALAREAERQRQDRLARAMEMMVLTRIAEAEESRRLREEAPTVQYGLPLWSGYPVVVAPGYWPRPAHHPQPRHRGPGLDQGRPGSGSRSSNHEAIVRRPPGSLIPVSPARSHHGAFQSSSDRQ